MKKYTLDQLRAFVTAVECGSFSAAGRRLGKTQSVISTMIQYLEIELGFELFDRSGRYPVLTRRGESVLANVQNLLQQETWLSNLCDNLEQKRELKFSIAVGDEALSSNRVEQLLVEIDKQFPDLQLEVLHPGMDEMIQLVLDGRCDLGMHGFLGSTLPPLLNIRQFHTVHIKPFVAPDHPLAGKDIVSCQDLINHRQLVPVDRRATDRWRVANRVWHYESQISIIELTKKGMGWSFQDEDFLKQDIQDGRLVALNAPHVPVDQQMPVCLLWRADAEQNEVMRFVLSKI